MGATVLQPPVATDILPASRGRSGKSSRTWANRLSHHPSHRPGARPPTGASSCRPMTIATSFKRRIDFSARDRYPQRLSGPGRKPPKPPGTATGTRSAPTHENLHRTGAATLWRTDTGLPTRPISLLKGSPSAGRPLQKCHRPGYPCARRSLPALPTSQTGLNTRRGLVSVAVSVAAT